MAVREFQKTGRGAMVVIVRSLQEATIGTEFPISWMTKKALEENGLFQHMPKLVPHLDSYDPVMDALVAVMIFSDEGAVTRTLKLRGRFDDLNATPAPKTSNLKPRIGPIRMRTCAHCGKAPEKLFRCSKCKVTMYCNKECQHAHWAHSHKSQCGAMSRLRQDVNETIANSD